MRILGIETSCDETAICLIEANGSFGNDFEFRILGNSLISQIAVHAQYGGVFPNLAKREHGRNLVPLLEQTLRQSGQFTVDSGQKKIGTANSVNSKLLTVNLKNLLAREPELYEKLAVFLPKYAKPEIDVIAVTVGPGLEPALWVGINFARALSLVWNIPIVAVNHMEGHVVIALIHNDEGFRCQVSGNSESKTGTYNLEPITYPLLSLLISGGHTELVLSRQWQEYEILGATRDDAVGEAFDKVARLLGLPYPGGASLSALAKKARLCDEASPHRITLPRPMIHDDSLDFSFAGLKTAVRRIVEIHSPLSDEMKMAIAREFEDAVTEVLVKKTLRAVEEHGARTVVVGGGVSANSHIRLHLAEALEKAGLPPPLFPSPDLATDNAIMIALAGYFRAQNRDFVNPDMIKAEGNLRL